MSEDLKTVATSPSLAPEASAQDYSARDAAAPLMTAGLLQRKLSVSPEMFSRYWRDVHGPLAARIRGFHQYWQHHLAAPRTEFWPVSGLEQAVPAELRMDGFAETTFRAAADRDRLGQDPAAQALFHDEQNVFRSTYLCPSAPGDSRTSLDRFADGAPQGPPRTPTFIVLAQRAEGVTQEALASALRDGIVSALASRADLMKLRLHLLQPFDPSAWNTPGVNHDLPPGVQFYAILEIAFADEASLHRLLSSEVVRRACADFPAVFRAVHTYPVSATYTPVYDGCPTLVGLKGLSVAETILATGARNQTSLDVLRLLHGPEPLQPGEAFAAQDPVPSIENGIP